MKILFICTHNRCRSILAEAISNHVAGDKIQAASAGSQPAGHVHPWTIKYLERRGVPTYGLRSKSWDELEAFKPDVVITVCDSAAQEACPVWFGDSLKVHWGLPDPSKLAGSDEQIQTAFQRVMDTLEQRIKKVAALDLENIGREDLALELTKIAEENQCRSLSDI